LALRLGIMGHFASGKSAAASFFINSGFFDIDLDAIGKDALLILKDKITQTFGTQILEQDKISAQKLGNLVFENQRELDKLNALVHPWMKERVVQIITQNPQKNLVIHAAILLQLGLKELCQRILYISCPDEILIARGQARNKFSAEKIRAILKMQRDKNQYLEHATDIIENTGTFEEFQHKLKDFEQRILNESFYLKT